MKAKIKKALIISTYILIVCGIVALGLCYIIIPDRTKSAIDIVVEYLNKPLGIAFGSTITLGAVIIFILTQLWKNQRQRVKDDIANYEQKIENAENKLALAKHELEIKESEIKTILCTYDTHIDKLTDLVVEVCETSPNAKIKAIGEKARKIDIELEQELEQKKDIIAKYSDDQIKTLLDKVNELEKVVKTYEQREETTND